MSSEIINWLKSETERTGTSQRALAKRLGMDVTAMNKVFKGTRKLKADELRKAERFFGSPASKSPESETLAPQHQGVAISEIDVRGGAGLGGEALLENLTAENGHTISQDAVKAEWSFPPEYLAEIRVAAPSVRILEIAGDSMTRPDGGGLHSGDRVMVDVGDRNPSPPGVFAIWDGFGLVVKRLERIPRSDPPSIRLISDNPAHGPYELTGDEVHIVGRVIWFARRL